MGTGWGQGWWRAWVRGRGYMSDAGIYNICSYINNKYGYIILYYQTILYVTYSPMMSYMM